MKKLVLSFLLFSIPLVGLAGTIDSAGTYNGKIKSIGVGFWGHVGVELDGVTMCNGHREVILLTSNPMYKELHATLLAAQASQQQTVLFSLENTVQELATNYSYCIITAASIGSFSIW